MEQLVVGIELIAFVMIAYTIGAVIKGFFDDIANKKTRECNAKQKKELGVK